MGLGDRDNQVYLIDFGLARMYRDPKTHLHIPYNKNCYPTGTASFASINNHLGVERSRRDDMESLAYILVYLLCGSLPWLGVRPAINMQWLNATLQQKMGLPLDLLGSACPNKFKLFLNYTRNLRFNEKPDYAYLCKIFRNLVDEPHSALPIYSRILAPLGNACVNASRDADIT
jgi:casein kinase I family protein HRR25